MLAEIKSINDADKAREDEFTAIEIEPIRLQNELERLNRTQHNNSTAINPTICKPQRQASCGLLAFSNAS